MMFDNNGCRVQTFGYTREIIREGCVICLAESKKIEFLDFYAKGKKLMLDNSQVKKLEFVGNTLVVTTSYGDDAYISRINYPLHSMDVPRLKGFLEKNVGKS